ncbi:MAG: hypothetical protein KJ002_00610 [Candidatus Dadabacteria bacterium]|nr:hypothetical protein [Candidatus Dadabacteria bacterium]
MSRIGKNVTGIFSAALCLLLLLPFAGAAQDTETAPDLKGVWKGTADVYYPNAVKKLHTELNVTEQDGWYFKGTRDWKLVDPPEKPLGYIKNDPVNKASEPYLGVIGFDGKSLTLVENGDWGVMKGALADADTIQLLYYETGEHPLVFRVILKREKVGE